MIGYSSLHGEESHGGYVLVLVDFMAHPELPVPKGSHSVPKTPNVGFLHMAALGLFH